MLINPFKGEDTVLNHLRFDFHGCLVRLLHGLRLYFLPTSITCSKILWDFFYSLCFKFCCVFTLCLLVVCLCLNFVGFFEKKFTCLASHKSSVVGFLLCMPFFSQYFVDLWLFVIKFCLEIVVAYCWYLCGLGFQKEIFLFCSNLSINLV